MNIHINLKGLSNDNRHTGLVLYFNGTTYEEEEYHTYLPNKEIAQLIQELSEILAFNLYNIDEEDEEE